MDEIHEFAIEERIPYTRGDLIHRDLPLDRPMGSDKENVGHHHVNGDDVHDPFWNTRELLQEPPGIGDDDWLGHTEATNPTRDWFSDR